MNIEKNCVHGELIYLHMYGNTVSTPNQMFTGLQTDNLSQIV